MDAYQTILQELAALQAPAPAKPMFTPEQQRTRIRDNNQQVELGLLGQLSPIEQAQTVGGQVFKKALGDRDEKITARGTFDPLTGETADSPEYAETVRETRRGKVLQAALATEERRRQDQMRSEDRAADRDARAATAAEGRALRMTLAQMGIDARADRAAAKDADKKAKDAEGKTLPFGAIEKLTKKETTANTFGSLVGSFKPELAGTPGLAGIENTLGKYQPLGIGKSKSDQSNWWQNYNEQKNVVRNELFGSALTAPEKAAFDAANITEGMEAGEITRRLAQQNKAAARAYNKLKQNTGRAGYNVSGFGDIIEEADVPAPGADAPAKPAEKPGLGFKIISVR